MKMNTPSYSDHARKRAQQRCIDDALIAVVSAIGHEFFDKDGSVYISCSKTNERLLAKKLRSLANKLEHRDPVFLVEGHDGKLITVGRQFRRHRRH